MDCRKIGIYGAGGFAREVAWLIEQRDLYTQVAYIDDNPIRELLRGLPVMSLQAFEAVHPGAQLAIAVGAPRAREAIARKCRQEFAILEDISTRRSASVAIGSGTIICSGSILTVDIRIGVHVQIHVGCTIGHDVEIGDFSTICPGARIAGNVRIGRGVFIGTGAVIINGVPGDPLVIGDHAVIAAGACVTQGVEAHSLYAGVPAVLKKRL